MITPDSFDEKDEVDTVNYNLISTPDDNPEGTKTKRDHKRKTLCKTTFNIVLIGCGSTEKTSLLEATQEACTKLYGDHVYDMSGCAAAVHLDELNKQFTISFGTRLPDNSGLAYINVLDVPYEFCSVDFFVSVCNDPGGLRGDGQDIYSNMMIGDVFVVCYSMDNPESLLAAEKFLELVSASKEWDRDNNDVNAVVCMTRWDRRALVPHSSQHELLLNGEALARKWNIPHITTRDKPDAESEDFWVKRVIERVIAVRKNNKSLCEGLCCCPCIIA